MQYPLSLKLKAKYGSRWVVEVQLALWRNGLRISHKDVKRSFIGRKKWAAPAVILIAKQLTQNTMKLATAQQIANTVKATLAPFCEVCEIAGSIRREKRDDIKDVEIVCIPKLVQVQVDMFSEGWQRDPGFYQACISLGLVCLGHPHTGKQVRVLMNAETPDVVAIDVFIATPENFGYIYMLRTGSSDWNQQIMIRRGKALGFTFQDGLIWYRGKPQHTPDEATVFRLLNMPFVVPSARRV